MYIFNYGAPIAVITINNDSNTLSVYTTFEDEIMINGMATVASLIKKYHDRKFSKTKNYTGYMRKEYIAVAQTSNPIYSLSIFGFLMRIIKRLDKTGTATVGYIVKIVLESITKYDGVDYTVVFKK